MFSKEAALAARLFSAMAWRKTPPAQSTHRRRTRCGTFLMIVIAIGVCSSGNVAAATTWDSGSQTPPSPPPPPSPPIQEIPRTPATLSIKQANPPQYPLLERCAGAGGTVVLILDVNPVGTVDGVSIAKSSKNRDLDKAAISAARDWTFTVANHAAARARIPVVFQTPSPGGADCPDVHLSKAGADDLPVRTFAPGDTIRLVLGPGLGVPGAIRARWYGDSFANNESGTFEWNAASQGDMRPSDGWLPGHYTVDVWLNEQRVAMLLFDVDDIPMSPRWLKVSSDKGRTTSVDSSSINRTGNIVELWWLENPAKSDAAVKSQMHQALFNCSDRTFAYTDVLWYSDVNGAGDVVFRSAERPRFEPVVKGSVQDPLLKFACIQQKRGGGN